MATTLLMEWVARSIATSSFLAMRHPVLIGARFRPAFDEGVDQFAHEIQIAFQLSGRQGIFDRMSMLPAFDRRGGGSVRR